MIKIFRKIRHNMLAEGNTVRYLKYAIGEIVLVVIGILIALQINNWNEARKAQISQKEILSNFLEDLKADSVLLQSYKHTLTQFIETQEQLYKANKGILNPENIENPANIRGSFRYHSVVLANHPDIAIQIVNTKLRAEILTYYNGLSQLNNSYLQFDNVIKNIVRPYLAANNTLNADYMFNNPNKEVSPFLRDAFYKAIMKKQFTQILFEANMKAKENIDLLDEQIIKNSALCESIQKTK